MSNSRPGTTQVQWETVCEVEHEGVVVIISCQPLRRPRYSLKIGAKIPPGKFGSHFQSRVSLNEQTGKPEIQRVNTQAVVKCIQMAEEKILEMVKQDQEDYDSEAGSTSLPVLTK